jgi:hypothetical protein
VGREAHLREIGQGLAGRGEDPPDLAGGGITHSVGQVEGRGPRLGRDPQHLDQEVGLGADGVLGGELHVLEDGAGVAHGLVGGRQHLVAVHLQLGRPVDRAGGQEDVQPPVARRLERAGGDLDVTLHAAAEAADRWALDLAGDRAHGRLVAGRGGCEARLQHIDAEIGQHGRHLQLVGHIHAEAGSLLAVPQGGVEDDDAARIVFGGVG